MNHSPVVVMAMGVGFCDWRTVAVLASARRMAMLNDQYVYILVQTQEVDYADTVCIGDLMKNSDLYWNTMSNVLLVALPILLLDCCSCNRRASTTSTSARWSSRS